MDLEILEQSNRALDVRTRPGREAVDREPPQRRRIELHERAHLALVLDADLLRETPHQLLVAFLKLVVELPESRSDFRIAARADHDLNPRNSGRCLERLPEHVDQVEKFLTIGAEPAEPVSMNVPAQPHNVLRGRHDEVRFRGKVVQHRSAADARAFGHCNRAGEEISNLEQRLDRCLEQLAAHRCAALGIGDAQTRAQLSCAQVLEAGSRFSGC